MNDTKFQGTGVALITPFKTDYSVDYQAFENTVEYCIKGKVNYVVVLGTTGEPATLNKKEKNEVINTVIRAVNKRVAVVVGIGGNNTREVEEEIKTLDTKNLDGILSVVPYYNKPNQVGIYEHFKAIARVSQLPVIMYNVPHRTGVNMNSETTIKLAAEFSIIAGVKEASGNMTQISEIIRDKPEDFAVISGDDVFTLPMIAVGANGVISVIANALPLNYSTMVEEALGGNYQLAREIHLSMLKITNAVFSEGNPAGVKAILHHKGIIENIVRLPLTMVSEKLYKEIVELVSEQS
jgi:4-hydroxy-tetrahydrodipicolinate synthase